MARLNRSFIKNEAYYFRRWHFCYCWAMMGRTTSQPFKQAAWDMTRKRIQALQNAFIRGGTNSPTIGNVYNSERLMAMILRWHVNKPDGVIGNNRGTNRCPDVAERNARANAAAWVSNSEQTLANQLTSLSTGTLGNGYLSRSLPTNNAELSRQRNFTLYTAGLI